ncbi:MAG TPA: aminotransferase class I/II-fold pyridoxal phosphate-dependent enzyme [Stellaceae bacterium]|jgi:GntR family transcriptional regulator/MocR family aminotransferase|nr:aminotransferase class I/II-fold pyridoxal phosphate-dependent enzyme [Stellaceae bacterium]
MRTPIPLLLDRSRSETLIAQLVDQLREAICRGRIAPGERLPSSRSLADQLAIARNTAMRAYEALVIEGYAEARPASGIFAAASLPAPPAPAAPSAPSTAPADGMHAPLPLPAVPVPGGATPPRGGISFDFSPSAPGAAVFPLKTWRRLLQGALTRGGASGLSQVGDPGGLAALRVALAQHLAAARGIAADPAQILVLSGVREGVALAARLLLASGRRVVLENPVYGAAAAAFAMSGAELLRVSVDQEGLRSEALPELPATLLYVTPSHQYPTGHTLSLARRRAVADWARRQGCYILEDDCGGDFRFEGAPLPAIAALAPDCTIHVGSFARALGAGLRLGYMVAPPPLVEAMRAAKLLLTGSPPWLEQTALADMIRSGSYSAHLARVRAHYRASRDCLLASLRRHFGEVTVSGESAGQHLLWQLPAGVPDAGTLEALARRARVGVYSLAAAGAGEHPPSLLTRRGLVLGYAALSQRQIEQGIARLSDAVDDTLDRRHEFVDELLLSEPPPAQVARPAPRFRQRPALRPAGAARAFSPRSARREGRAVMPMLRGIYRYPVKGLSPQPLPGIELAAGKPFPHDRTFAFARPGSPIDPDAPRWGKKGLFVMLMLDEALARVQTHLDVETLAFTVSQDNRQLLRADLGDPASVAELEAFFHRLVPTLRAPPRLVRAPDGHFMDKPDNVLSLINLATLRSLEERWGYAIDPLRFRANFYIDGARPWEEFDWLGGDIVIGDAVFRVDRRNGRCGATNVNPATGQRDLDLPGSLRATFGHKDLGIYLVVRDGGKVVVGDAVTVPRHVTMPADAAPASALAADQRRFICRGCYFVYEETMGAPQSGVAPGTPFAELAAAWRCPDCGTDKSTFRPYVELTAPRV